MQNIVIAEYKISFTNYRRYLIQTMKKKNLVRRGNKKIKETHYCSICGDLLAGYNYDINNYRVYKSYYKITMPNNEIYYMCYNENRCRHNILQKNKTSMLKIYKVVH